MSPLTVSGCVSQIETVFLVLLKCSSIICLRSLSAGILIHLSGGLLTLLSDGHFLDRIQRGKQRQSGKRRKQDGTISIYRRVRGAVGAYFGL